MKIQWNESGMMGAVLGEGHRVSGAATLVAELRHDGEPPDEDATTGTIELRHHDIAISLMVTGPNHAAIRDALERAVSGL